ncbi:MAG: hydrogenase nickel incorporation protein HypB [Xanthobacteraceae bacterium]|jgi:hydrogenase nickel incorporation protein HypB
MCGHCGCGHAAKATILDLQTGNQTVMVHGPVEPARDGAHEHAHADSSRHSHGHGHDHGHDHHHGHGHGHEHGDGSHHHHDPGHLHRDGGSTVVELEARILAKNDALAARNRGWFAGREILALNLVSSPGAGKTTLLERSIRDLGAELRLFVVEGDQATANDGARIRAAGAPVVQVNTGTGCHLEADMVARGLRELKPEPGSVVMIENVGNLVCPAMFDLGEWAKVVILSVTEGDDKPLKYPHMFRAAGLMIINKIDLLPYVEFDVEQAAAAARQINPGITIVRLSARTGEGLEAWYRWLRRELASARETVLGVQRGPSSD